MITINNMHFGYPSKSTDVRVDRKSVLGNPYKMSDESQRDKVCDMYETYFNALVKDDKQWMNEHNITQAFRDNFMRELGRISIILEQHGEVNLWCWCAPKRCHSETIKKYLQKITA
ncbi:hypothetical protein M9Y10_039888 [Tritrichomonas musculus]|uniref:DUF4326 domain-containing protein n=1 Tax=Tritrichomonas musculus TaxID=1915356 RepID=A0ABR2GRG5_9EUKA